MAVAHTSKFLSVSQSAAPHSLASGGHAVVAAALGGLRLGDGNQGGDGGDGGGE